MGLVWHLKRMMIVLVISAIQETGVIQCISNQNEILWIFSLQQSKQDLRVVSCNFFDIFMLAFNIFLLLDMTFFKIDELRT